MATPLKVCNIYDDEDTGDGWNLCMPKLENLRSSVVQQ